MSANRDEVLVSGGRAMAASSTFETTLIRKLQVRLIPYLFLFYIVGYLDRINIGFAALTMNKELAITSQQFGLLVGVFFFGYCLFEVPSNLLLHKIGARVWIARILLSWGIVALGTSFVHSVAELCIARFLLGVAEAGFFPGIVLYLTYWFQQREQAQAIALFLAGLPVTSIVGSPISGFILDRVHWMGMSSWRWLLILEGIPALACGVLTYFVLPSRPADAKFLTQEEKNWIATELRREEEQKQKAQAISATQAMTNGRVWHLALIGLMLNIGMYTVSFWMPQEVKALSSLYSNTTVGLLVMIPHLVGLVAMVWISRSSDRTLERKYHAAIPAIVAGIAFVSLGATRSTFLSVALLSCVAAGIYSVYGPLYSLPGEFLTGYSAASGIAVISSVANFGGFVGPYAVGAISTRTGSLYGGLALAGMSLLISATLMLLLPMSGRLGRSERG
jgi:ACS family tartrate transporter-like MFS transporter